LKTLNNIFEIPQNSKVGIYGFGAFGKKIYNTLSYLRKDINVIAIGDDKITNDKIDAIQILNFQDFTHKAKKENLTVLVGAHGETIVDAIAKKLHIIDIESFFIEDIAKYEHNTIIASGKIWNGFLIRTASVMTN